MPFLFWLFLALQSLSLSALVGGTVPSALADSQRVASGAAAEGDNDTRMLVHLLDYLSKDYAGAVAPGGRIISESEYKEQQEFAKLASETSRNLKGLDAHPDLRAAVDRVAALIAAKADPQEVATQSRLVQTQIIGVTHLSIAPTQKPDLAQGRALFAANCSICHGETGLGDGPGGAALTPKPANFHDDQLMASLSPLHVFNTVRLGIPGTAMPPFLALSDAEAWNVAYYVLSLSGHTPQAAVGTGPTTNDDPLGWAKTLLGRAQASYTTGDRAQAKSLALQAYIEGIEPVEARLRASDPRVVVDVETRMGAVRGAIEQGAADTELSARIAAATQQIDQAAHLLQHQEIAPGMAFVAASTVLLREGFEAVLLVLALLGVIRATGSKAAARWVHAGWMSALGCGFITWSFSGLLLELSGASREMMEGVTSLFAVVVLLGVGFWLHSRTEIGRWNHFIKTKVRRAMAQKNYFGLAVIAFIAVFREAFETVLFLRAIWVDSGDSARLALGVGTGLTLVVILVVSWGILRFSTRVPVRKLFAISAIVMAVLAFILTGKGLHSLQEVGLLTVTTPPFVLRNELLGIFPTWETLGPQLFLAALMAFLWEYGRRPGKRPAAAPVPPATAKTVS